MQEKKIKVSSAPTTTDGQGRFRGCGGTHSDKAPDAGPEAVVGELAPAAGVGNGPVVAHAADGVDEHGDDEDEAKDASGPDVARLVRLRARAGVYRPGLEEVGALVWVCADKGKGRLRAARVAVAEERDDGRLGALLRRLVLVAGAGLLLTAALGRGLALAAGRSVFVSQHELAAAALQVERGGAVGKSQWSATF